MNDVAVADKTVTTKELAESLGLSVDTITNAANKLFNPSELNRRVINGGNSLIFTELQATAIKIELQNHSKVAKNGFTTLTINNDLEAWELQKRLDAYKDRRISELTDQNEKLQIELDESKDWYSVKRVQLMGYLTDKDPRKLWRPLRRYCIEHNLRIKKIFDANYGDVAIYPGEAWKNVYGINLLFNAA
jgi:hypothetical protein